MNNQKRESAQTGKAPPALVGVGASAGGLKALQQFVEAIPPDSGMAYVVISHLDPERESRMAELLQDRTLLPVMQVSGPVPVAANHVYTIPPGHDLAMRGTTLGLRERGERADHAPVDLFFRTMAEAYGADAVGVVLSGTGSDGTAGIRHIREAGGITVAQSPEEAEYDGMPASAIATGLVDLVLPSGQIPQQLVRLRRTQSLPAVADGSVSEAGLAELCGIVRARTGHDFSQYKRSTVLRRLDRRLRFNEVSTLDAYLPLLRANRAECDALVRDLLISVSSFFRDPEAFLALARLAPALFEGKGPEDTVRVWVVGCATGEEAYSIAMVLSETAATLADAPRLQLFATDIDEKGYGWGREGLYSVGAVANIEPERLQRFFTKEAGGYRVARPLREQVLFAGHNVLHDPPFSRMDLISCRNLFIYLQPEAQERVLETFHFALNPGGALLLGSSESPGDRGLFTPLDGDSHRLFRRSTMPHRAPPRLSAADPVARAGRSGSPGGGGAATEPAFSFGALHLHMLEQYAPASAVVDDHLNVVHLSAGAGRFLRLGEGEPSNNVIDLAQGDLRSALRTALHQAFVKGRPVTRKVRMDAAGGERLVSLQVRPPAVDGGAGRFALVVFEEAPATAEPDVARLSAAEPPDGATEGQSVAGLEEELLRTRDQLESTTVAHDQTVAELQTVNEELRSINEEQKAAGEELVTSREEIQSINEELTTINQEYQSTIEELKRTNADLENLIESTEIGTIFLDRGMRIRRFTPAVGAFFNFVAADQGRPLADITHRLNYPELVPDVTSVLASLERIQREVGSDTGESYIVRINPYRSHDGGHDGVVLTFFENTAQHRVEEQLREAKIVAESANLAKTKFLATLSHEFRTPLSAIIGYADLLDINETLSPSQKTKVERIKAGGWHLVAMIDEILNFAKLDAGQERVTVETLDARGIAREALALAEPAAAVKRLALVLDVPEVEVRLETDENKARQILINLCGNAVKYTEAGDVRLRVHQEASHVWFEVTDTGIGIAPENQARIFERFWQVDGGASRPFGGMGIGLAAAREYAQLLGGDVEVESELGKGATFRLWLPVANAST